MSRLRIHAKVAAGKGFRRHGQVFGPVPKVIDTMELKWTDQMVAAAKADEMLHVDDVEALVADLTAKPAPASAPKKTAA